MNNGEIFLVTRGYQTPASKNYENFANEKIGEKNED